MASVDVADFKYAGLFVSTTGYILIFVAGIVTGFVIHTLERMMMVTAVSRLLDGLGRICLGPFLWLSRRFQKRAAGDAGDTEPQQHSEPRKDSRESDPRERKISDSAQTIKNILLSLATVIQQTNKAAEDSSHALADVKNALGTMGLASDLAEAHTLLIHEIDQVISSNSNLKGELAHSQRTLTQQKRQIEDLSTAVRIDGLTQLANRAYFDEKMAEMIILYKRYREPFSVMMIDLDNFKKINDTYGHQGGDRILKGVALKLKASLRGSDFIARFGGDEFAVILPKTDVKAATDVAWKLCNCMRESRFLLDGVPVVVTLSNGLAEICPGDTEDSLLRRADRALYHVKEMGRNSVYVVENS